MIDSMRIVSLGSKFLQTDTLQNSASKGTGAIVQNFADTLRQGEQTAIQGMTGEVPMQEAVEKVLEVERTLQTVIAVRDKIVSAYLEISRMQI